MTAPIPASRIDHAIQLYQSGKSLQETCAAVGIGETTLARYLDRRGIPRPRRRPPVPPDLITRYIAGESVQRLAREYSMTRRMVGKMLTDAGVPLRGISESMVIRWARNSPEDRAAMLDAAHAASRGRTASYAERVAIAASRSGRAESPLETYMVTLLSTVSVPSALGVPCGKYNIDVVAAETVAVEIYGGYWHAGGRHRARFPERSRYILDQGYSLMIVWVNKQRYPLGLDCAYHVKTLVEISSSDPSARRQYWVVRGDGKVLAALQDDGHDVPFVDAFGRRNYTRP